MKNTLIDCHCLTIDYKMNTYIKTYNHSIQTIYSQFKVKYLFLYRVIYRLLTSYKRIFHTNVIKTINSIVKILKKTRLFLLNIKGVEK